MCSFEVVDFEFNFPVSQVQRRIPLSILCRYTNVRATAYFVYRVHLALKQFPFDLNFSDLFLILVTKFAFELVCGAEAVSVGAGV